MKIVLTGGGSGGHITPILAVAQELKRLEPAVQLIYIGQRGDSLADIAEQHKFIDESYSVRAGKFRRYHGEGLKQLADLPTLAKNGRDAIRTFRGLLESRRLLKKIQPDVIFIKGGFVGVPVGLAAAWAHIPFVTHDSDAIPGLANRIIAKWAAQHTVALPKEVYRRYDQQKTVTVGVPVQAEFAPVTVNMQQAYKRQIGVDAHARILFVTGGGLGAQRLNDAIVGVAAHLLERYSDLVIVHVAGRSHEAAIQKEYAKTLLPAQQNRVLVKGFITDVYVYSGAADVIVTRAGATTLAEFTIQQKACIIVPNPFLTGGHQLKNAAYWTEQQAVLSVSEDDLQGNSPALADAITKLLESPEARQKLADNLSHFAHPDAARQLAMILLDQVQQR